MSTGSHFDPMIENHKVTRSISLLTDNPPSPGEVGHTTGSTFLTLFEQWFRFFYVPQVPNKWKCCEMGPTVFLPYILEDSRESNRLQMSLQRQHLLLRNLNSTSVGSDRGFEPAISRLADQRSPEWANQTAKVNKNLTHCYVCYLLMEILSCPVRVIDKHFGQNSTTTFAICLLLFSVWFPPIPAS